MQKRNQTIGDFVACFIALSDIDSIHLRLDDFLAKYIDFLVNKPYSDKILMIKINHLFEFVVTFHKLKLVEKKVSLRAYRGLLKLKLSVINTLEIKKPEKVEKKVVVKIKPKSVNNGIPPQKMREPEKKILEFIKSKDKTVNSEIFDKFVDMHKRSIKRHVSNLIKRGYIKRQSEGKSVYYLST